MEACARIHELAKSERTLRQEVTKPLLADTATDGAHYSWRSWVTRDDAPLLPPRLFKPPPPARRNEKSAHPSSHAGQPLPTGIPTVAAAHFSSVIISFLVRDHSSVHLLSIIPHHRKSHIVPADS